MTFTAAPGALLNVALAFSQVASYGDCPWQQSYIWKPPVSEEVATSLMQVKISGHIAGATYASSFVSGAGSLKRARMSDQSHTSATRARGLTVNAGAGHGAAGVSNGARGRVDVGAGDAGVRAVAATPSPAANLRAGAAGSAIASHVQSIKGASDLNDTGHLPAASTPSPAVTVGPGAAGNAITSHVQSIGDGTDPNGAGSDSGIIIPLRGTVAPQSLRNGTKPWHHDVFAKQNDAAAERKMWHGEIGGWTMLVVSVVVMLLVDYFLLEPMSRRREPVPPDVEAALEKVFSTSSSASSKGMCRRALIQMCQTSSTTAKLFRVTPSGDSCNEGGEIDEDLARRFELLGENLDDPISLEELKKFYAEEVQPMSRSTLAGHALVLCFWVAVAGAYNLVVWQRFGTESAWQFSTGYILEWLLSMDNLFVFHLVFKMYNTPRELVHKALFAGVVGALLFRMVAFVALTKVMHMLSWARFLFGGFLIYSGVMTAADDGGEEDVSDNFMVVLLEKALGDRLLRKYDVRGTFVLYNGKLHATLLLPVIVCIEVSDILFAVDSVSAKVAQIPDYYMSYSSSIFAMFGLRAMFFIIQECVDMFELLKYGLCFILVFIGVELILSDYIDLPAKDVCALIVGVFVLCIGASVLTQRVRSDPMKC